MGLGPLHGKPSLASQLTVRRIGGVFPGYGGAFRDIPKKGIRDSRGGLTQAHFGGVFPFRRFSGLSQKYLIYVPQLQVIQLHILRAWVRGSGLHALLAEGSGEYPWAAAAGAVPRPRAQNPDLKYLGLHTTGKLAITPPSFPF
jgi:hypothetical protein